MKLPPNEFTTLILNAKLYQLFWPIFVGGCNLNRDIPNLLKETGFSVDNLETMYLPKTPKWLGYNYWGTAS
jgi:hypothetical protein